MEILTILATEIFIGYVGDFIRKKIAKPERRLREIINKELAKRGIVLESDQMVQLQDMLQDKIAVASQLDLVYNEHFADNRNHWVNKWTKDYSATLKNGQYIFEHSHKENCWLLWNEFSINRSRPFIIESCIHHISGPLNHGYGIVWGLKNTQNFNYFIVSGDGHVQVACYENDKWKAIADWTFNGAVNQEYSANEFKIFFVGGRMLYYINQVKVAETPSLPFYGDSIGFINWWNRKIAIDYILVRN